jgi:hypothetical protein
MSTPPPIRPSSLPPAPTQAQLVRASLLAGVAYGGKRPDLRPLR